MTQSPAQGMALDELICAYSILNHLSKAIEERKKQLRTYLLFQAETNGELNENGHHELRVGDEAVIRERKVASEPDTQKLVSLLETLGLAISDAFDEIKVHQLNLSKLKFLVDTGKLKAEHVEALRTVSYALRVVPGEELKSLMDEAWKPDSDKPSKKKRPRGRR